MEIKIKGTAKEIADPLCEIEGRTKNVFVGEDSYHLNVCANDVNKDC